jgi:PTH1 family peptidyl-tRNA hydrolase
MGIGRPIGDQDPADFVLKPFSKDEQKYLKNFLRLGVEAVESIMRKKN